MSKINFSGRSPRDPSQILSLRSDLGEKLRAALREQRLPPSNTSIQSQAECEVRPC